MSDRLLVGPEPLGAHHIVAGFACGVDSIDTYLVRQALADQRGEKSRTYVFSQGKRVVAFGTFTAAGIEPAVTTARLAAGQGGQLIPVILLARLAVDESRQGRGIGEAVLIDALARAARAADLIGARAVLVHATNALAAAFYSRYGFEPSPTDELHLVLPMKNIRASLGRATRD